MSSPAEEGLDPAAPIPFIDLDRQHRPLQAELLEAIARVAASGRFIHGPEVARLESSMARRFGVAHAIGVSSGTDALLMLLMALGIGAGDEVVTSPFSFVSTAEVIARLGARPVFADVLTGGGLIDPQAARRVLGPRTRAIIPVHLYGQLCDMETLAQLARESGAALLEDCAQSTGARIDGRFAGAFGLAGAFSFFPTKNLGTWGDGGMILTGDPELAGRLRQIRDHGAEERDRYVAIGGNFRLDTIQAAILEVKLGRLDAWLAERREAARLYAELFEALAARRPALRSQMSWPAGTDERHAFNLYVIETDRREALRRHLDDRGIQTSVYYPVPLHLQPCFAALGAKRGDFPIAEAVADRVLALPLFVGIRPAEQRRVAEAVGRFHESSTR